MAKGLRVLAIARVIFGALVLLAALAGAGLADPTFPPLTDRVVDDAGVLSAPIRAKLIAMLAEEERTTGNQLAIVTVKSLQGYSIEDYGYQLGRHWGIGQKDKNNGALLLVAPSEHKVRIEVGYGLEGVLTDAQSRIIIERTILPAFRRGDYDSGVLAGTAAILDLLGGVAPAGPGSAAPLPPAQGGSIGGLGILLPLIFFFLFFGLRGIFWPLLLGSALSGGMRRGGFYGGGGMGGGFGGGFSGGGGGFGGGGASGGW